MRLTRKKFGANCVFRERAISLEEAATLAAENLKEGNGDGIPFYLVGNPHRKAVRHLRQQLGVNETFPLIHSRRPDLRTVSERFAVFIKPTDSGTPDCVKVQITVQ